MLLLVTWRVGSEIRKVALQGKAYFTGLHGAAALDKCFVIVFSLLYLTTLGLRVGRANNAEDAIASLAVLTGWTHLLVFLLGFQSTGPFIIMIREMIRCAYARSRFLPFSSTPPHPFTAP